MRRPIGPDQTHGALARDQRLVAARVQRTIFVKALLERGGLFHCLPETLLRTQVCAGLLREIRRIRSSAAIGSVTGYGG